MITKYIIQVFDINKGIGDWGLGNPQSPIPNPQSLYIIINNVNNSKIIVIIL